MTRDLTRRQMSRRNMLAAMGLAGAAVASIPVLGACGVGGKASAPNGAADVSGGFDWKKASGTTINILQTPHPYQKSYQPLLKEFTELTGINVNVDLVPEADYFTKLNTELAGGTGKHDAFMLGAYFIWQYGPAGWIEDLHPWLQNSAATGPDYDFEDIFEGLRTSTRWDFTAGNPLGSGGQWASTTSSSWPSTSPTVPRTGMASRPADRSPGQRSTPAS
jgi:multiple sugar transport system substrate-binding protein